MELYFDIDLCTGCKSCEVACARRYGRKRIAVDVFDGRFPITAMCRHCETSPCVEVCPKDAIKKVDSIVHVNENL
jgi:Fe-S-cluster-containing hydrogenase component 2